MIILNTELEFNFNDADDLEKLENAIEETKSNLKNIKFKGKKTSEVIRETCKAVFDCFNSVFGEGTDKKIFGNKTSLNVCVEAFKNLCDEKIKQENDLIQEMSDLENKYNPNRTVRKDSNE